eukprot:GHVO01028111.1.p1 GENE.GHVO01028111.1~~GHVO01028111.1.p1  ORF type:complete len:106 (-),score=8.62 GHVO01028111.1:127-444(-)
MTQFLDLVQQVGTSLKMEICLEVSEVSDVHGKGISVSGHEIELTSVNNTGWCDIGHAFTFDQTISSDIKMNDSIPVGINMECTEDTNAEWHSKKAYIFLRTSKYC